jgi:hypothetical protein
MQAAGALVGPRELAAAFACSTMRSGQIIQAGGSRMSSEQNLNSPDFTGNATSAIGAVAVTQAASGMSGWQRKLMYAFAVIIVLATGAGTIDKLMHANSLPARDGQRTRDTPSDIHKANKVDAT